MFFPINLHQKDLSWLKTVLRMINTNTGMSHNGRSYKFESEIKQQDKTAILAAIEQGRCISINEGFGMKGPMASKIQTGHFPFYKVYVAASPYQIENYTICFDNRAIPFSFQVKHHLGKVVTEKLKSEEPILDEDVPERIKKIETCIGFSQGVFLSRNIGKVSLFELCEVIDNTFQEKKRFSEQRSKNSDEEFEQMRKNPIEHYAKNKKGDFESDVEYFETYYRYIDVLNTCALLAITTMKNYTDLETILKQFARSLTERRFAFDSEDIMPAINAIYSARAMLAQGKDQQDDLIKRHQHTMAQIGCPDQCVISSMNRMVTERGVHMIQYWRQQYQQLVDVVKAKQGIDLPAFNKLAMEEVAINIDLLVPIPRVSTDALVDALRECLMVAKNEIDGVNAPNEQEKIGKQNNKREHYGLIVAGFLNYIAAIDPNQDTIGLFRQLKVDVLFQEFLNQEICLDISRGLLCFALRDIRDDGKQKQVIEQFKELFESFADQYDINEINKAINSDDARRLFVSEYSAVATNVSNNIIKMMRLPKLQQLPLQRENVAKEKKPHFNM